MFRHPPRITVQSLEDIGEELLGATSILTAAIRFRDNGLIPRVDNARRYSDIVLLSALFSSTKRYCLMEAYICTVVVDLGKNSYSTACTVEKCERGYARGLLSVCIRGAGA